MFPCFLARRKHHKFPWPSTVHGKTIFGEFTKPLFALMWKLLKGLKGEHIKRKVAFLCRAYINNLLISFSTSFVVLQQWKKTMRCVFMEIYSGLRNMCLVTCMSSRKFYGCTWWQTNEDDNNIRVRLVLWSIAFWQSNQCCVVVVITQ